MKRLILQRRAMRDLADARAYRLTFTYLKYAKVRFILHF